MKITYLSCRNVFYKDFFFHRGTNETSGEVMVNGEVKNTSSTPVVSITNPSIDSTSPSNSSGGKQVSVVSLKI